MSTASDKDMLGSQSVYEMWSAVVDGMVEEETDTMKVIASFPGGDCKFTLTWDNKQDLYDDLTGNVKDPLSLDDAWSILCMTLPDPEEYYDGDQEQIEIYDEAWDMIEQLVTETVNKEYLDNAVQENKVSPSWPPANT